MNLYTKSCKIKSNSFKLIVYTYKVYKNWTVKYTNYPSWISNLIDDVKDNNKLVVPMDCHNKAKELQCLSGNICHR